MMNDVLTFMLFTPFVIKETEKKVGEENCTPRILREYE
jgi:hypothetical protein